MGVHRRIEALEGLARRQPSPASSAARERMVEHLSRLAALRRGELGPEEAAEVEAVGDAVRKRRTFDRGEVRR